MESVKDFDMLICGNTNSDMHDFKIVMDNLSKKIAKITELIIHFHGEADQASVEIPFYGRNLLESCMTGLLGRLDPFRLITVFKVQSDDSYDLGKKVQSAVGWSGDIMATNKAKNLWSFENKKEDFDRALLGNYVGEIVWKPGFRALSDYVGNRELNSQWLDEIMSVSEEGNFQKSKSTAGRMFSSFSKGVHSECLVDIHTVLDSTTLTSLLADTYKLCATLGLISHFVGFMASIIGKERALAIFLNVEEMIGNVQL